MLFNINTLQWDEDILKILNIPKSILPEVRDSSEIYGYTDEYTFGGAKNSYFVPGNWRPAIGSFSDKIVLKKLKLK